MSDLHVTLDAPLPEEVATGAGTAIFVCGWCWSPRGPLRRLSFALDGEPPQPVRAARMPRLDPFIELREPLAYRSGFWGFVRIGPPAGPADPADRLSRLSLRAELRDGTVVTAPLGELRIRRELPSLVASWPGGPAPPAGPPGDPGGLVAICMATHNPPPDLLAVQLQSIREQSHARWVCLISDDGSRPEAFAALRAAVGDDPRFVLSRSSRRLGFYRNFERALTMVGPEVAFVALADQDDRWDPDKLAMLVAGIGDAPLIYSDARIVARDGALLSETYWSARTGNHHDLLSLLTANSVTGAAALLRADLLAAALPFPPAQFAHYHDHWLALVALARGEIRFVDRPLYDYVQHGGASLGHAAANRMTPLARRLRDRRRSTGRDQVRLWRMHYFVDLVRLFQVATILQLRCGPEMAPAKRRVLERFLAAERSPGEAATLFVRGALELAGLRHETLGGEWVLFRALLWRRLLTATAGRPPDARWRLDAVPPADLAPGPPRAGSGAGAAAPIAEKIAEKIAPLDLDVRADAPPRINLLIPTIDLDHFFGGYIAKFNLALVLARRGHRVRIVTVDPVGSLPRDWRARIASYAGLADLGKAVEIAFARSGRPLEVSPADRFIATTWWTAQIAAAAAATVGRARFLYLIQEYEPFTFPMGSYAALARGSYDLPHDALFSTELLRGYFRAHRIGVYGPGVEAGDRRSASFDNAITPVSPPAAGELAARGSRRLLFYARPEPHAARNLFELGVLALEQAARGGAFREGWELRGIGTVSGERRMALGEDLTLELLPRVDQREYAQLLGAHDVGLALMYTPHPSLVPLEMASAGLLTVTNSFENKTPAALAAISPNLITAEPTVAAIAAALARAAASISDVEARVAGSDVRWPRAWSESFDEPVLAFVEAALAGA